MIVTVTMNPAIDRTAELEQLERGSLNRLENCLTDIGGKGINVSKAIKAMGGESIATGFCGGSTGKLIEETLENLGIKSDFIHISNETRVNQKIVERKGTVTELNEPGPFVTKEELNKLTDKLMSYASENTLFVLSGSIPKGIEKDIYFDIITLVKERGAKVFLDADGELFARGLEGRPDYIKPNRSELEGYYKRKNDLTEEDLLAMGKDLLAKGSSLVAVSLGHRGAIFLTNEHTVKCPGMIVEAHSTVGAGDAMVAALSYSLDQKADFTEAVRLAMAVSAGAVTTQGTNPPSRQLIDELKNKVEIIPL